MSRINEARLLSELTYGAVGRRELLARLGVSAMTLNRAVAKAGEQVLRLGAARSTRYIATRSLSGVGRSAPVHRVTESGELQSAGRLHLLARGRQWYATTDDGRGTLYEGLPPFAVEMTPRGYLGRGFSRRYPELGLPERLQTWSVDDQLTALARRGEDTAGDAIIGQESVDRFLANAPVPVERTDFPELARQSALVGAGSSAAGEQPKFTAFVDGRHVLVKFAPPGENELAARSRDLLRCEHLALEVVAEAGVPAAVGRGLEIDGWGFLEVERFDRVGPRGRRALLSLEVVDNEYLGTALHSWSVTAARLSELGLPREDVRRIYWLDAFGQLIANDDRHAGNLSLFGEHGRYTLAPAYDMLPMQFAPNGAMLVDRPFAPAPPTSLSLEVWHDAARWALEYWHRLASIQAISQPLRALAAQARERLEGLAAAAVRPAAARSSTR